MGQLAFDLLEEPSKPSADYTCGRSAVLSVDFSPNNRYLAAGTFDGDVKVWRLGE